MSGCQCVLAPEGKKMDSQQLLFDEPDNEFGDAEPIGGTAIKKILVEGLFGQFDYELPDPSNLTDVSKVMILYGENGSGKTTLLRALFHLLSPASDRGHRSALAKIPFKLFKVIFEDGGWLSVSRGSEIIGAYSIEGRIQGQSINVAFAEKHFGTEEQKQTFASFISTVNQTAYFLSADRAIMSDVLPNVDRDEERAVLIDHDVFTAMQGRYTLKVSGSEQIQRNLPLARAVQLANDWIRRQAIRATTVGTENTNTIYTDVVRRIADSPHEAGEMAHQPGNLLTTLEGLAERNAEYSRFQFTSPLQVDGILNILGHVDQPTATVIENVLTPYIDGTKARLDALENLRRTTASFVENLNSFYTGKKVTFGLNEGLKIRQPNGSSLDPSLLSSGEQHLLLMFCHTILPRRGQCTFIIDEPELSLNIKWQRKLIDALQELVAGARVQFIFASHSIEFLSEHLDNVVTLVAKNGQSPSPGPTIGVPDDTSDNT
jgi:energy-coupling factor transporter ATP-binding protein EcfA2